MHRHFRISNAWETPMEITSPMLWHNVKRHPTASEKHWLQLGYGFSVICLPGHLRAQKPHFTRVCMKTEGKDKLTQASRGYLPKTLLKALYGGQVKCMWPRHLRLKMLCSPETWWESPQRSHEGLSSPALNNRTVRQNSFFKYISSNPLLSLHNLYT